MQERRKEQREPSFIGGHASFFGQSTASVVIRNTSPSGAKLVLHNGSFVPDQFNFVVPQWQAEVVATTRWRRQDQIGVEFERLDKGDHDAPLLLKKRIRQLEVKNARLKCRVAELSG